MGCVAEVVNVQFPKGNIIILLKCDGIIKAMMNLADGDYQVTLSHIENWVENGLYPPRLRCL